MPSNEDPSAAAAAFLRQIAELRVPFLFERSRKFAAGRLDTHRFLTTLAIRHIDRGLEDWLVTKIIRPEAPQRWRERIRNAAEGCIAVHLGFEAAQEVAGYKVYFEYPLPPPPTKPSPCGSRTLVHRAFKWRDGQADAPVEALYTCDLESDRPVARQIADLLAGETDAAPAVRIGTAFCELVASRAPGTDLMLLDVREIDSRRRSYDLQFYDADLRVGDAVSLLRREAAPFGFEPEDVFAALAPVEGARLGHVAAGRDRGGTLFATLYFGAERR